MLGLLGSWASLFPKVSFKTQTKAITNYEVFFMFQIEINTSSTFSQTINDPYVSKYNY